MADPSRRSEPALNAVKGQGLPSGTVTFLLTDVEGSTALWEEAPEAMRPALVRHDAVFETTLEAAEAIGADTVDQFDVLDGVGSLVEKSLVRPLDVDGAGTRFTMLETIREYALEQLAAYGEADDARRQHAEHFLALAEEAEPHLE
ncbi:MAG TPA: hypothetical protein VFH48_33145 [Chloroflexota bacterium]|nr:hypothetical protein [Chloroflexota bacterium]